MSSEPPRSRVPVPGLDADTGAAPPLPVKYRCIWTPFDAAMREAMLRPTPGPVYYDGPEVEAFEAEAAAYLGVPHAVGVSSGTTRVVAADLPCFSLGAFGRLMDERRVSPVAVPPDDPGRGGGG